MKRMQELKKRVKILPLTLICMTLGTFFIFFYPQFLHLLSGKSHFNPEAALRIGLHFVFERMRKYLAFRMGPGDVFCSSPRLRPRGCFLIAPVQSESSLGIIP